MFLVVSVSMLRLGVLGVVKLMSVFMCMLCVLCGVHARTSVSVFSCDIRVVFAYNYYISCFSLSTKSTSGSHHQTLSGASHSIVHVGSSTAMTSLY